MLARVPESRRDRVQELGAKDEAGEATPEDEVEAFGLLWPSYFADPPTAPPVPPVAFSTPANHGLWADLVTHLPALEASLPSITIPVGVLVGELSPMPPNAGTDSAARIPGAWADVVPGAGHFPWYEAPGSVLVALNRLVGAGDDVTRGPGPRAAVRRDGP
jgi:pimeloyl-ACP methyl ester carboxylesterase